MKRTIGTLIEDSIYQSRMSGSYIARYDLEDSYQGTAYANDPEDFPEKAVFTFERGGWALSFKWMSEE